MIKKLILRALLFFTLLLVSVLSQNCDKTSSSPYFLCDESPKNQEKCKTYAILHANSCFSSLANLSSYLHISPSELAEANGISPGQESLITDRPLLIPIECKCSKSGVFEAERKRTTIEGESFYGIAESLEGLTTCNAIREKNPTWNLLEKMDLVVPLKCACPASDDLSKFLLSYPVKEGDTLSELALKFNVSQENIVSANIRYTRSEFKPNSILVPLSTLLVPLENKSHILGLVKKPEVGYPSASIKVKGSHKRRRKPKMWMTGVYIAVGLVGFLACIAILATFFFIHLKKKREIDSNPTKNGEDLELQQLSLSIRTTSDKKLSFEGSQYNFDGLNNTTTTPHKSMPRIESYTLDELHKATEDFSSSNLIGGSVYHGRLKGKNLAIKRVAPDTISKIDFHLFQGKVHHPNTIRLLGTCVMNDPDCSYIVLEYAKNGTLKDWIHGGLAIKSHFIASCSCFLTWHQRVKICLDVATALQHMHHIMSPCYVHMNIKSRNIFLDEDFGAKLGNFGMSKCFTHESKDQENGYLAPEYLTSGTISPSIDIFAYGVILSEVLSGKPPIKQTDEVETGGSIKLSDEIKRVLGSDDAEELRGWIDGALGENYSFDAAVMLANLARSCIEDDPLARPNAGEIVEKLLRLVEDLPEGDQFDICESSCKPLVKAAAKEL